MKKLLLNVNTKIFVNHTYRFNSGLAEVRNITKRRQFGDIILIRAVYYGGLLHNGVHVIDTLRMITDSEFKIITAKIGTDNNLDDPCIDAELSSSTHTKVRIFLESFQEKYYQLYEMEIRFEKGRIRIMDFGKDISIDKVIINQSGEKELKFYKKIAIPKNKLPSVNASNQIEGYFIKEDTTLISEIGIEQAGKTMMTLWKLREKAMS